MKIELKQQWTYEVDNRIHWHINTRFWHQLNYQLRVQLNNRLWDQFRGIRLYNMFIDNLEQNFCNTQENDMTDVDNILLKELGSIMAQKEALQKEIDNLNTTERELCKLLNAKPYERTRMNQTKVYAIREAIVSVLKKLRNDGEIWIHPRRISELVTDSLPNTTEREIMSQLRVLGNNESSSVAHNGDRGHGSAYFYTGMDC